MKICITPNSLKLFGTYVNKQLPELLKENKSASVLMTDLFNLTTESFANTNLTEAENKEIVLQHMSIVPQIVLKHLSENPVIQYKDSKFFQDLGTEVINSSKAKSSEPFENLIKSLGLMLGNKDVRIPDKNFEERFVAISKEIFRTNNQEAIWNEKSGYSENIQDPNKAFEFKVSRNIIKNNNSQLYQFKLTTLGALEKESGFIDSTGTKDKSTVKLVLVNSSNEIVKFNSEGVEDVNGNFPAFNIATNSQALANQKKIIAEQYEDKGLSKQEALKKAAADVSDFINYIETSAKSKDSVYMTINIGQSSLGFIALNRNNTTNLSDVINLNTEEASLGKETTGKQFYPVIKPINSNKAFRVFPKALSSLTKEEFEVLHYLITAEDVIMEGYKSKLNNNTRLKFISYFIQQRENVFAFEPGRKANAVDEATVATVTLGTEVIKASELTLERLTEWANKRFAKEVKPELITEGVFVKKSIEDVTNLGEVYYGKDGKIYESQGAVRNFADERSLSMDDFILGGSKVPVKLENGEIKTGNKKTLRDQVTSVGFTNIVLNGENKIVAMGSYLKFEKGVDSLAGIQPEKGEVKFRSISKRNQSTQATSEQNKAALEWFKSSPLFDILKLNFKDGVSELGPNFVANFIGNTINLYQGSSNSDIYHEAFHAFFDGILSSSERKEIYDSLRNRTGTFNTTVNGQLKTISWSSATDLEIEEYLAEEFREFSLSDGKKMTFSNNKVKSFFQKLLALIKNIFGGMTYADAKALNKSNALVDVLFNSLYKGEFTSEMFTARTDEAKWKSEEITTETGDVFSLEEISLVMESMQSMLSEFTTRGLNISESIEDKQNSVKFLQLMAENIPGTEIYNAAAKAHENLFNNRLRTGSGTYMLQSNPKVFALAINFIKSRFEQELKLIKEKLKNLDSDSGQSVSLNYQSQLLEKVLKSENFGEALDFNKYLNEVENSTLLSTFLNNYSSLDLSSMPESASKLMVEDLEEEDTESWEVLWGRGGQELMLDKTLSKATINMLSSVRAYTQQGKGNPILNPIGVQRLLPFKNTLAKVAKLLANTVDAQEMSEKLKTAAKTDKEIAQIFNMLGDITDLKHAQKLSTFEHKQWTSFWQSINKSDVLLSEFILQNNIKIKDDGTATTDLISKVGKSQSEDLIIDRQWNSNFNFELLKNENEYVEDIDGTTKLDLQQVYDDWIDSSQGTYFGKISGEGPQIAKSKKQQGTGLYTKNRKISAQAEPVEFLRTFGIEMSSDPAVMEILYNEAAHFNIPLMAYLVDNISNRLNAVLWNDADQRWEKDTSKQYIGNLNELFKGFMYRDSAGKIQEQPEIFGVRKALRETQYEYADEFTSFSARNAKGDLQSEKSFNSSLLLMVNSINKATSIEDLYSTPGLEHLNPKFNSQVSASNWLTSMFRLGSKYDKSVRGKRDVSIKLHVKNLSGNKSIQAIEYSGLNEQDRMQIISQIENDKGESQIGSDQNTKVIGDFYLTLTNRQEIMRSEAKSTSLTVYADIKVPGESKTRTQYDLAINKAEVEEINSDNYKGRILYDKFIGHIINDIHRVHRSIKLGELIKNGGVPNIAIDVKQLNRGTDLFMFDAVFPKNSNIRKKLLSNNEIINEWNNSPKLSNDLIQEIETTLLDFFVNDALNMQNEFGETIPLSDNMVAFYTTSEKESVNEVKDKMYLSFIVNNFLSNADYSATFLGDASVYDIEKEAFHKRIAGFISTGKIVRRDAAWLQYINSEAFNNDGFSKKHNKTQSVTRDYTYTGKLRTGVMKEIVSDAVFKDQYKNLDLDTADYSAMEEADGQGWISFDAYRLLNLSIDEWSDAQERVYQKMLNEETLTSEDRKITFPVRKFQTFGAVTNAETQSLLRGLGLDFANSAFHKFSLMPLVPEIIKKAPKLVELHESMMEQGLAYVTMNSGSKLSTLTKVEWSEEKQKFIPIEDDFYNAKDRLVNDDFLAKPVPWTINEIDVNSLKSQIFIKEGYKGYVTLPTQLRKIALNGILDNGVPFDFQPNAPKRKSNWEKLTNLKKREKSKKWAWYKDFTETLDEMEAVLRNSLLEDIQMKEVKNANGDVVYEGDSKALVDYIKTQLKDNDLLPEEINYIAKPDGTLIDDLSFSLIGSKIEELLTTLVDKKLRRLKANGEKLTQVSSAMWESYDYKTGTKEDHEQWGTSGLKFHFAVDENGKYIEDPKTGLYTVTEMEIKISLQGEFKKLLNTEYNDKPIKVFTVDAVTGEKIYDDAASLANLNKAIKDPVWLEKYGKMIDIPGVRIPSQGSNAFIATRVAEFLPESAGPIIIMPAEVVVNTGSDYDVDAMFTLMKNFISKYGRTEEVKYIPNQKEDADIILLAIEKLEEDRESLKEERKELLTSYIEYLQEKGNVNEKAQKYIDRIKKNQNGIQDLYKQKKEVYSSDKYSISKKIEFHQLLNEKIAEGQQYIEESELELEKVLSDFFKTKISNKEERKEAVNSEFKKFNDPIKEVESEIKEVENKLFQLEAKLQGRTTKGLENRLIDLIQERVLDPSNMSRLVSPNTTEAWEGMAREAGKKLTRTFDKTKGGNTKIFQYRFNLLKHQEMSVALDSLGIAAVASTFYAVFTTFQATLQSTSAKDQKQFVDALKFLSVESNSRTNPANWGKSLGIVESYQSKTLKLESNEVFSENALSLGMVENVNGQLISDLLSQLINGYVDAANSPWIAEMQGDKENTPTILFLTMAGVSPRNIISMMTNPLVMEYNSNLAKYSGIFGDILQENQVEELEALIAEYVEEESREYSKPAQQALSEIIKKYLPLLENQGYSKYSQNLILNKSKEFDENELENRISLKNREIDFRDIELLAQFLAAKEMAEDLNTFTQLQKFDTQKISSISEAQNRIEKIKEFKSKPASKKIIPNSFFEGVKNSPIGKFDNDKFIVDLFSKYFGVKNNPALILKSLGITVPKGMDKAKILTQFKDDFIWFLYQNSVYANDSYTTSSTSIVNNKTSLPGVTYTLNEVDGSQEIEINKETGVVTWSTQAVVNLFGSLENAPAMQFFSISKPKDFVKFNIEMSNLQEVSKNMTNEEFLETFGIFDNASNSYLDRGKTVGRTMILTKAALYNTSNPDAMFNFGSGVANILKNIHSKYKTELDNYAFFRDIKYDYNEPLKKMNMYISQIQDPQMAQVYRENIADLKNSPHAEVREFFGKFDHIAIMQTGLTIKSKYALTKLGDQTKMEKVIDESIGIKYINGVLDDVNVLIKNNVSREEIDGQIIDQFAQLFNDALSKKAQKVRGHNYTINNLNFSKAKKVELKRGKNLVTIAKSFEEAQSIMRTEGGYIINSQIILDAIIGDKYSVEEVMQRSKGSNLIIVNEKMLVPESIQPDILTQEQLDAALKTIGIDNTKELPKLIAQSKNIGKGLSIERSSVLKGLNVVKDEAMANRSSKAIGASTKALNPVYESTSEAYVSVLKQDEFGERNVLADKSSRKKQFTSKDVVWIFGSGMVKNAYTNETNGAEIYFEKIKNTFNSYHQKMIDKAMKEGVKTFIVGNYSGIDALAKQYLENNGYVAVRQYTKAGVYFEMVKSENLKDVVHDFYKPAEQTVYLTNNSVFNEVLDKVYEVVLTNGVDQGVRKQPNKFKELSSGLKEKTGYEEVYAMIVNAIKSETLLTKGKISYEAKLRYELKNSSAGLLTLGKSETSLFDSLVEQVFMNLRNQAQKQSPVVEVKKETIEDIYDKLGFETASENVEIVDNIWANMKDKSVIKAYRASKANLLGSFNEYNSIGNPISAEGKPVGQATKEFIGWLEGTMFTELEQPYRKALLDAFESGELKGMKIEYYKDIGVPSHATALDYYINSKTDVNIVKGSAASAKEYTDLFELGLLEESKKQTILDNFAKKFKVVNALSYIEEALKKSSVSNEVIVEQLKKCY